MTRHYSQDPRFGRSDRRRKREDSPWPRIVGFVLYFISVAAGLANRHFEASTPVPPAAPCSQCVTQRRETTSLRWVVPGYAAVNSEHVDGNLSLRVREGWRGRWLRIEVEERARPWRE